MHTLNRKSLRFEVFYAIKICVHNEEDLIKLLDFNYFFLQIGGATIATGTSRHTIRHRSLTPSKPVNVQARRQLSVEVIYIHEIKMSDEFKSFKLLFHLHFAYPILAM